MLKPLKFMGYAIVFQEVYNETTLAFSISGCPYRCNGCHSQYLWEYEGDNLIENMEQIINKYNDYITCVCFMGGDQNMDELASALQTCKNLGLKTCVYSGSSDMSKFKDIFPYLDWLKLGEYNRTLYSKNHIEYGVKLATSNQHMYRIINGEPIEEKRANEKN